MGQEALYLTGKLVKTKVNNLKKPQEVLKTEQMH